MSPKPLDFQGLASEKSVQSPSGVGMSEQRQTLKGGYATSENSFIRHDKYFFKDGNVTFLVGGILYCVHRYFFSRHSVYFSTRLAQLDIRDHEALPTIISIGDINCNDFEALLSVLYPVNFENHELSYEQWKSLLHLSTLWGFASLRRLALKSIKPPTPHDQLVLARAYSIDQWVLPALAALCSRTLPLRLDEARQMDMEDVILVTSIREEIRGGALRVDLVDIPSHIKMVLARNSNHPMGNDTYRYCPMSGTIGQESASTVPSGVNLNVEVEDAEMTGVNLPFSPQERFVKEGGTKTSDVRFSPIEVPVHSPDTGQGIDQLHVKGPPQVLVEEVLAVPAPQTREIQEQEEMPREAAPCTMPQAQAIFTTGGIMQKPEALVVSEEPALLPKSTTPHTSDTLPNGKNLSPNNMECGPLPSDSPVQHLSVASLTPHEPQSTHLANSIMVTPSLANIRHSFPTLVSKEPELVNDKLDCHIVVGECNQAQNTTVALPTEDITELTVSQPGHSSLESGRANVTPTVSTVSMSGLRTPVDDAQVPILEDDSYCKLTRSQRKRMQDRAKRQLERASNNKSASTISRT